LDVATSVSPSRSKSARLQPVAQVPPPFCQRPSSAAAVASVEDLTGLQRAAAVGEEEIRVAVVVDVAPLGAAGVLLVREIQLGSSSSMLPTFRYMKL